MRVLELELTVVPFTLSTVVVLGEGDVDVCVKFI